MNLSDILKIESAGRTVASVVTQIMKRRKLKVQEIFWQENMFFLNSRLQEFHT